MVDVFEEVNEDLKNEEFANWLKKFGPRIIILSILIVLFTASKAFYSSHKSYVNKEQTVVLNSIVEMDKDKVEDLIAEGDKLDDNHKFLSDFIIASGYIENGDLAKANEVYLNMIDSKKVPDEYKQMASLYVAQNILNMESGDLKKAESLMTPMLNMENPFYYLASEKVALIKGKMGDASGAKAIFEKLSMDDDAPEQIRDRADKLKTLY